MHLLLTFLQKINLIHQQISPYRQFIKTIFLPNLSKKNWTTGLSDSKKWQQEKASTQFLKNFQEVNPTICELTSAHDESNCEQEGIINPNTIPSDSENLKIIDFMSALPRKVDSKTDSK